MNTELFLSLTSLFGISAVVVGCSGDTTPATGEPDEQRYCLVTDGPTTDGAVNERTRNGFVLGLGRSEARGRVWAPSGDATASETLEAALADNCDVVVTVGSALANRVGQIAAQHPRRQFITLAGETEPPPSDFAVRNQAMPKTSGNVTAPRQLEKEHMFEFAGSIAAVAATTISATEFAEYGPATVVATGPYAAHVKLGVKNSVIGQAVFKDGLDRFTDSLEFPGPPFPDNVFFVPTAATDWFDWEMFAGDYWPLPPVVAPGIGEIPGGFPLDAEITIELHHAKATFDALHTTAHSSLPPHCKFFIGGSINSNAVDSAAMSICKLALALATSSPTTNSGSSSSLRDSRDSIHSDEQCDGTAAWADRNADGTVTFTEAQDIAKTLGIEYERAFGDPTGGTKDSLSHSEFCARTTWHAEREHAAAERLAGRWLDIRGFTELLGGVDPSVSAAELERYFGDADADGDARVDAGELRNFLLRP